VPPRDKQGILRYNQHLPFQVFCCESGTHVVDPTKSYYQGISYRAGTEFQNLSTADNLPTRDEDAPCLDSSQTWFCRDLWVRTALDAMEADDRANGATTGRRRKRDVLAQPADHRIPELAQIKHRDEIQVVNVGAEADLEEVNDGGLADRKKDDPDANAGSDYDAMPQEEGGVDLPPLGDLKIIIPNSVFRPARILINPRCLTTYAGVAHTQLARDLFEREEGVKTLLAGKYVLDDWEGAPDSFVCQEQKWAFFIVS